MNSAILLKGVTKKFGKTTAVDNLNLDIKEGEIYGFIGPNGSGKTTTIKMMAGIYKPSAGEIEIEGHSIEKEPEKAKSIFGYIPDEPFIYERMTGREFLYLVGALYKIPKNEVAKKIEELVDLFPIKGIIDGYAESYSRGNKQKLIILAALLHSPQILLIDEPIVGLDPESARITKRLLEKFSQKGGTIFVATHTLSYIQNICTRIGVQKEGKLIVEGTLDELQKQAQSESRSLEELYLKLAK